MGLFKPNIEKLEAKGDVKGLIKAFKNKHSDPRIKDSADTALCRIIDIYSEMPPREIKIGGKCVTVWGADRILAIYREVYPCKSKNGIETVCDRAILTLGEMGAERPLILPEKIKVWVVEPLIQMVRKSADVEAITYLGEMGDKRAVEPLIEVLKEIPERGYYISAMGRPGIYNAMYVVTALAKIGDERAIESLKGVSRDSKIYAERFIKSCEYRNFYIKPDQIPEIEKDIQNIVRESIIKIQMKKR